MLSVLYTGMSACVLTTRVRVRKCFLLYIFISVFFCFYFCFLFYAICEFLCAHCVCSCCICTYVCARGVCSFERGRRNAYYVYLYVSARARVCVQGGGEVLRVCNACDCLCVNVCCVRILS